MTATPFDQGTNISALKVEEDLQRKWREGRERELQSEVERNREQGRVNPVPFRALCAGAGILRYIVDNK